ncbi:MAG: sulfite exporter TauE/SafE family protein, partial [Planctomycetota bacterium]|nr:sulfite exporter TauE/SafE family protein [Planctomycetota bacterium]
MLPCGFSIHSAVATSSFLLLTTGTTSAISHLLLHLSHPQNYGSFPFTPFILLMPPAILGAQIGAWKLKNIRAPFLRILFASTLLLIAARLILS